MDNDIYNNDITDGSSFVATDDGAIIKVIGIGGGGGSDPLHGRGTSAPSDSS